MATMQRSTCFVVGIGVLLAAAGAPVVGAPEAPARVDWQQGMAAYRAGRWAEARAALERSLVKESGQPEALFALAGCFAQLDNPPMATRLLRAALNAGVQDYAALQSDPRLAPLRERDDFKAVLA